MIGKVRYKNRHLVTMFGYCYKYHTYPVVLRPLDIMNYVHFKSSCCIVFMIIQLHAVIESVREHMNY